MDRQQILRVQNYSVTYDGRSSAVDRVNLDIRAGEIVSVVGESGSGKSTLLHGIAGLLPVNAAQKGEISLFGENLFAMDKKKLGSLRGRDLSIVFQDTGRYLNPVEKLGKQYTKFLQFHTDWDKKTCQESEENMLLRLHLGEPRRVLSSYPFELSGGMRQRVGIAMAMTLKPKLLLADEPTSALDVTVQAQVVRQMLDLAKTEGTAILLVTHNMGVAACISDRIGVMHKGAMVELGEAKQVIDAPESSFTKFLLDSMIEMGTEPIIP